MESREHLTATWPMEEWFWEDSHKDSSYLEPHVQSRVRCALRKCAYACVRWGIVCTVFTTPRSSHWLNEKERNCDTTSFSSGTSKDQIQLLWWSLRSWSRHHGRESQNCRTLVVSGWTTHDAPDSLSPRMAPLWQGRAWRAWGLSVPTYTSLFDETGDTSRPYCVECVSTLPFLSLHLRQLRRILCYCFLKAATLQRVAFYVIVFSKLPHSSLLLMFQSECWKNHFALEAHQRERLASSMFLFWSASLNAAEANSCPFSLGVVLRGTNVDIKTMILYTWMGEDRPSRRIRHLFVDQLRIGFIEGLRILHLYLNASWYGVSCLSITLR